jgi:ABC-type nickel/cobalt efflux system permease component RcnA
MGSGRAIIARIAAYVLCLALALMPLFSALTHGPGQVAMQDDHMAWHAEQGEQWHATGHDHHGTADHDHSTTVILPAGGNLHAPPQTDIWAAQANQLSGIIRDGPRRPPRPS